MAYFEPAYKKLRKWEGHTSKHPKDRGGLTFAGISRKIWPDWNGWVIYDKAVNEGLNPANDAEIWTRVEAFYRKNFWDKVRGTSIPSQNLAEALLSFAVNLGVSQATKLLQECLDVTRDGILGDKTIAAIHEKGMTPGFLNKFLDRVAAFYVKLIDSDPSQKDFEQGWKNRVEDYRPEKPLDTPKGKK